MTDNFQKVTAAAAAAVTVISRPSVSAVRRCRLQRLVRWKIRCSGSDDSQM